MLFGDWHLTNHHYINYGNFKIIQRFRNIECPELTDPLTKHQFYATHQFVHHYCTFCTITYKVWTLLFASWSAYVTK